MKREVAWDLFVGGLIVYSVLSIPFIIGFRYPVRVASSHFHIDIGVALHAVILHAVSRFPHTTCGPEHEAKLRMGEDKQVIRIHGLVYLFQQRGQRHRTNG